MLNNILKSVYKFITHRLFILAVLTCVMFFILINRLFTLQIIQGEEHLNNFTLRISRDREIDPIRGNIYDRHGRPLASNALSYSVILDDSYDVENKNDMIYDLIRIIENNGDQIINNLPIRLNENNDFEHTVSGTRLTRFKRDIYGDNRISDEQLNATAEEDFLYLRDELFNVDIEQYNNEETLKILAIRYTLHLNRYFRFRPETIANHISDKTLADIRENNSKFPGISIIEEPLRVYNDGQYFAHIIGYTGAVSSTQLEELRAIDDSYRSTDIVGQSGIEREMETSLRGQMGSENVLVDSLGRTIDVIERTDPVQGNDVYLTIDKQLQMDVYDALERHLASLVADRITNYKSDDSDLNLDDVFAALINNNIISINEIASQTESDIQRNIYTIFLSEKESIIRNIEDQLTSNPVPLNALNADRRSFVNYIFRNHINNVLIRVPVENRNTDSVYVDYINGRISLKAFLEHAISADYVDIDAIGLSDNFYSNNEIYDILVNNILEAISANYYFDKEIYTYLLTSNSVSNRDMVLLLYEQDILEYDEDAINRIHNNQLNYVDFMKEKILELEITPQELALDPYSGSVVVTDINSGEVLALVSYPSYDNNKFVNGLDSQYYTQLQNDLTRPLFHRALQQRTAPGSTFKMITGMAALTEGVITPNERIRDQGLFTKINPPVSTWLYGQSRRTQGLLDIVDAIATSCNYFFSEVTYRMSTTVSNHYNSNLGLEVLGEYAAMFGLDRRTGIELPEYSPQMSTEDAIRSSMGQGTHNYTSAQLARYMATMANGGTVYNLSIIDKIASADKKVIEERNSTIDSVSDFNEEYLNIVRDGMYNVTSGSRGSSRNVFNDFPVSVAGKTGTAQESGLNHALFVGYAPYENPEISFSVVIPNGMGSNNATVLAKEMLKLYFRIDNTNEKLSYDNILQ
ncbi:penicillin-binding protein 2 [Natranaerovirga hydrolytica]|uniref:Penicillin-binding protein 2 n=1 Tax=Natranaerovirga hydrolytica TaxID=680378 RepID=A0A4R1N536_9FIRM|nr:penicillin-binding transpeptidase domain-containing protein [Natranaerovirga hydrolytica]TCK98089.1 penicillin-binding protein 2 [Natranaerovirga hydrolytica]